MTLLFQNKKRGANAYKNKEQSNQFKIRDTSVELDNEKYFKQKVN